MRGPCHICLWPHAPPARNGAEGFYCRDTVACNYQARIRLGMPRWAALEAKARDLEHVARLLEMHAERTRGSSRRLKELPPPRKSAEYQEYLSSSRWREFRDEQIRAVGYRCEACDRKAPDLEVHHITYDRLGRELPTDVVVLCRRVIASMTRRAEAQRAGPREHAPAPLAALPTLRRPRPHPRAAVAAPHPRLPRHPRTKGRAMSRENAQVKARRLLTEGRVRVVSASEDEGFVCAEVRGDSARIYRVNYEASDGWSCGCPTVGMCSHVKALMLITVMEPRKPL